MVDALSSLAGSRQAQAAWLRLWRTRDRGGPEALSELRVARVYTDMAVHLALLDVGTLPPKCRPRF